MTEVWLEVHLLLTDQQRGNVPLILQEIVKYCADELKSRKMRKTFHYFFEPRIDGRPGFEILFRIEVMDYVDLNDVEKIITARINQYTNLIDGVLIKRNYHGEVNDYGEDGWELAKLFFEIGSEIAIGMFSENFRKGRKFNVGKFVHCFLNQQGVDEEIFHANALIGRAMINLGVTSMTQEVEERVRKILERVLNEWRRARIEFL